MIDTVGREEMEDLELSLREDEPQDNTDTRGKMGGLGLNNETAELCAHGTSRARNL